MVVDAVLTEPLRAKNMLWIKGNFIHLEAKGSHSDLKSLSQVIKSSRNSLFVNSVRISFLLRIRIKINEEVHSYFEGNLLGTTVVAKKEETRAYFSIKTPFFIFFAESH